MKAKILILSIVITGLLLSSCKTINQSDSSYYGYNNKPQIAETNNYETSQKSNDQDYNFRESEVIQSNNNTENQNSTIIENNYYFYHPITHYGYYPWWLPPRNTIVYAPLRSSFFISFSYGYHWYDCYDPFVYYPIYSPIVYYPYPVYYPVPYPHYYDHWYPNYKPVKNAQKDTYRDFGPSRGSYSNTGYSNESKTPANRRSGISEVPSTNTKDIFQNTPDLRNRRTGMQPTKDNVNAPSYENTNSTRTDNEMKPNDVFKNSFDKDNSSIKKGENSFEPSRRIIPQPTYDKPSHPAPSRAVEPVRINPSRSSEAPARSSSSNSKSATAPNNDQPANKRSK